MINLEFFISTLSGGGAERVLTNLLKMLPPEKYNITLVTLLGGVNEAKLPEYVNYKKIIKTSNAQLSKALAFVCFRVMPPRLFHRLFLHGNFDIEIAYLTGIPTRIVQHSTNKSAKKICFIHGDITESGMAELYGSLNTAAKLYKSVNKVCFVSNGNMQTYVNVLGNTGNLCVVHNIVDVDTILSQAAEDFEPKYNNNTINIISVGRLAEQKGFLRLINAAERLNKEYNNYTLTIMGNGEQKEELERQIREKNLNNIILLPFRTNPYPLVKNADLFFCASYWEGYSTAVSEAVLLGTPVITTDCAGMKEIFADNKGGRIIENSDTAIFNSLKEYLSNRELRLTLKSEAEEKQALYERELRANIINYENLFNEVIESED